MLNPRRKQEAERLGGYVRDCIEAMDAMLCDFAKHEA